MDIILLPAIPATTGLREALGVMRTSRRSALVTQVGGQTKLISAREVRQGLNRGRSQLLELVDVETLPGLAGADRLARAAPEPLREIRVKSIRAHIRAAQLGTEHLPWEAPSRVAASLDRRLRTVRGDYALMAGFPGVALVLTRHETRAELYGDAPKSCACENPVYVHEYEVSDGVQTGQKCRQCKYRISCS